MSQPDTSSDHLLRFTFADTAIRGAIIRLGTSYHDALRHQIYTPPVQHLLGQSLAAAGLLSSTLKMDGLLALQARSEGSLPLLLAECHSRGELRGIARGADGATDPAFHSLLRNGHLAISLMPASGQRYQGIVALDGSNLAECLESYFRHSEQLATRLWLAADAGHAGGLLLQRLPGSSDEDAAAWGHLQVLAETLKSEELTGLPPETVLHRLFHQESLQVLGVHALCARCSCSRTRTMEALISLGRRELDSIIAEQGEIVTHCQFCNREYRYSPADIASLPIASGGAASH